MSCLLNVGSGGCARFESTLLSLASSSLYPFCFSIMPCACRFESTLLSLVDGGCASIAVCVSPCAVFFSNVSCAGDAGNAGATVSSGGVLVNLCNLLCPRTYRLCSSVYCRLSILLLIDILVLSSPFLYHNAIIFFFLVSRFSDSRFSVSRFRSPTSTTAHTVTPPLPTTTAAARLAHVACGACSAPATTTTTRLTQRLALTPRERG